MRNTKAFHGHITSLYRVVLGLLFTCHGAASLFGIFGGARAAAAPSPRCTGRTAPRR
jgi:putative oxidoreductase